MTDGQTDSQTAAAGWIDRRTDENAAYLFIKLLNMSNLCKLTLR